MAKQAASSTEIEEDPIMDYPALDFVLMPITIQKLCPGTAVSLAWRYLHRNFSFGMKTDARTSEAMKALLKKILETAYFRRSQMAVMINWQYPDRKIIQIRAKLNYVHLDQMPLAALLEFQRYVDWCKHLQFTPSQYPQQSLTRARREYLISEVVGMLEINKTVIGFILADMEKRPGVIFLDIYLSDKTFIELEWFILKYHEEVRLDQELGRFHCLC